MINALTSNGIEDILYPAPIKVHGGYLMGRPVINIVGQKFGKLTVLSLSVQRTAEGKPFWNCRCDCGVEKEIAGGNLKSGQSQSCGCERRLRAGTTRFYGNKFIDLTGQKFGRWEVIGFSRRSGKTAMWNCRCACGTDREVTGNNLNRGMSQSCGCLHRELASVASLKHGQSKIKGAIYNAWVAMRNRCNNINNASYQYYGGRGITVCARWDNFSEFFTDMEPSWQEGLSLDRINNDGNYEPSNCKWSTQSEQVKNQRHTPRGTLEQRGWVKKQNSNFIEGQLSFDFRPAMKLPEFEPPVFKKTTLADLGLED